MAGDADTNQAPANLPKAEVEEEEEEPVRAPVKFPPDVTEATVSMAEKLTTPITVSEAGQRNACNVRASHANLTEETTHREADRRATPTEAGKVTVLKSKATKRFSAA